MYNSNCTLHILRLYSVADCMSVDIRSATEFFLRETIFVRRAAVHVIIMFAPAKLWYWQIAFHYLTA